MARRRRQHACRSECAIVRSIALRCQITLEWTAATRTSTPSVCHDATIRVSHSVWSTDPADGRGGGGNKGTRSRGRSRRGKTESSVLPYVADSDDTFPFLSLPLTPRRRPSSALPCRSETKSLQPPSATLHKYPRSLSLLHNHIP